MNEKDIFQFIRELEKENNKGLTELIKDYKVRVRKMIKNSNPWREISNGVNKRIFDRKLSYEGKMDVIRSHSLPIGYDELYTARMKFFDVGGKTIAYLFYNLNV